MDRIAVFSTDMADSSLLAVASKFLPVSLNTTDSSGLFGGAMLTWQATAKAWGHQALSAVWPADLALGLHACRSLSSCLARHCIT